MKDFFYFQLCLDNYVRECELSPFSELCLLSGSKGAGRTRRTKRGYRIGVERPKHDLLS